jgi:hypothetical protein
MPYHCEELANHADLVPLARALADMQGTDVSKCGSTMVSRRKPKASRRPSNSLSSSSDPAVLGAIGAFGTAAFSIFGKNSQPGSGITSGTAGARAKEQQSLTSEIYLLPPADITRERCFPLRIEFQIGPQDNDSGVNIQVGQSRAELESRVVTEFSRIEPVIGVLCTAWQQGNIAPNLAMRAFGGILSVASATGSVPSCRVEWSGRELSRLAHSRRQFDVELSCTTTERIGLPLRCSRVSRSLG